MALAVPGTIAKIIEAESSRVSNVAAEREMVKRWADGLRKQLDDVHTPNVTGTK